jgi:hypothetical protein
MGLKLEQNQTWKTGNVYVRIVELRRLEVKFKEVLDLSSRDGSHHTVSKKEFCRLLKGATLVDPEDAKGR